MKPLALLSPVHCLIRHHRQSHLRASLHAEQVPLGVHAPLDVLRCTPASSFNAHAGRSDSKHELVAELGVCHQPVGAVVDLIFFRSIFVGVGERSRGGKGQKQ